MENDTLHRHENINTQGHVRAPRSLQLLMATSPYSLQMDHLEFRHVSKDGVKAKQLMSTR